MLQWKKSVAAAAFKTAGLAVLLTLLLLSQTKSYAKGGNVVYLPLVGKPSPAPVVPSSASWLDYINYYRATASLPPVRENASMSSGDYKHAIYIVKNDELQHDETPGNPWYTPEGQSAARSSNLAAHYDANATDHWAIDLWMTAPFHAVGILDPRLVEVGYGSYRESDGKYQMGAALNVITGINYSAAAPYPILWPADGMTIPVRSYQTEYPNPLTSCPGYTAPSGVPLIIQMGSGSVTPAVSASSFIQNGKALEHCVFSETTYANPDANQQSLGRSILNMRDAVVLIPRQPLTAGGTYSVSLTINGKKYAWSFTVSSNAQ